MKKSKKLALKRAQSSQLEHEKHPPLSVTHSAQYLHYKATIDANTKHLPINLRVEHIKTMIILAKIKPCFAVLRMTYPENGWLYGNVFCKSLV